MAYVINVTKSEMKRLFWIIWIGPIYKPFIAENLPKGSWRCKRRGGRDTQSTRRTPPLLLMWKVKERVPRGTWLLEAGNSPHLPAS